MLNELLSRYPALVVCRDQLQAAMELLYTTYCEGGRILVCGNGGSCADSEHIVGELMKGFLLPRPIPAKDVAALRALFPEDADRMAAALQRTIPAISLPSQVAVSSAYINDVQPDMVYAQLVYGYPGTADTVIGISTSGNSANVVNAIKVARACGKRTLGLTGAKPGQLDSLCDIVIKVPETETYKIQELHLPVYHYLCAALEQRAFGDEE